MSGNAITATPSDFDIYSQFGYTTNSRNFSGLLSLTFWQTTCLAGYQINLQNSLLSLLFPNLTTITGGGGFGLDVSSNTALTSLSAPVLQSCNRLNVSSNNVLTSVAFPALTSLPSVVATTINSNPLLTTISFDALVTVTTSALNCAANVALTTFNAPLLTTIVSLSLSGCTSLTTLSLPSLVTASGLNAMNCSGCTALTTVSLPNYLPSNTRAQNFSNCALDQASVDHILARCVANAAYVSGTISLNGGTNATPSAAGLADKATLVARGCTVNTN